MNLLTDSLGRMDVLHEKKRYLSKYDHVEAVLRCVN
jgi:hypothetical protein